jgi:pyruvate,water dikinase
MSEYLQAPAQQLEEWRGPATHGLRIHGVAASRGVHVGRACVVRSDRDLMRIERGDVLVCEAFSPAWCAMFKRAGAVVADKGGILCNAASIAREYRIPAVVATGNGTLVIRDGCRVSVDGDRGVVTVLSERGVRA